MRKPKKKIAKGYSRLSPVKHYEDGYNTACMDWEKFLPDNGDLHDLLIGILHEFMIDEKGDYLFNIDKISSIAKAIHKRLQGDDE